MTQLLLAFKLQGFELSERACAAATSQSVSSGRGRAEQNVWAQSDADSTGASLPLWPAPSLVWPISSVCHYIFKLP